MDIQQDLDYTIMYIHVIATCIYTAKRDRGANFTSKLVCSFCRISTQFLSGAAH